MSTVWSKVCGGHWRRARTTADEQRFTAIASVIFYAFLIDKLGRRHPVLVSSVMCSICLWIVGAYVKIGNPAAVLKSGGSLSPSTAAGGRAATALIMIYSVL